MFETAYSSAGAASRRPWTFTLSLISEGLLVAALALAPLLTTPRIAGAFEGAILLVAPPKPPVPTSPPPPSTRTAPAAPQRFVAELTMPTVMPDRAERLVDDPVERPTLAREAGPGPETGVVESIRGTGMLPAQAPYVAPPPKPAQQSQTRPPDPPTRVLVGGDVQGAKLIRRVAPAYPPLALQTRVSGTVTLRAVISAAGEIQELAVVSGHPLLIQGAMQAVQQWRYAPTLLNGRPVEVVTVIEVHFRLR